MSALFSFRSSPLSSLALALLVGIVLIGCDEEVLGPTLRGTVDGQVRTFDDGVPVADASVTTSPATGAYLTDKNGRFRLSNIESGPYNITVRKKGFRANTLSVAVRDDETTPATILLERSAEATQVDSVTAEIVNWTNRVKDNDSTFVDVEYRVRNVGTTEVTAYEVYIRIETTGEVFFWEIQGETLPPLQADIATFSKFVRTETAQAVRIDDIWFTSADS